MRHQGEQTNDLKIFDIILEVFRKAWSLLMISYYVLLCFVCCFVQDLIAQRMKEALQAMEVDVQAGPRKGTERNRAQQSTTEHIEHI